MAKTLKTILSLDSKPFADASKKVNRHIQGMSKSMRNFNRRIGAPLKKGIANVAKLAAAAAAAAVAIGAMLLKKVSDFGDTLDKTSKKTGLSIEELARLQTAAELSGASVQSLDKGMKAMALLMYEAGRGTKTYTDVLDSLGVSFEDLNGQTPDEKLNTFLVALSKVKDETLRAGLAAKIFGRAGTELLPMISDGADAFRKLKKESDDLGVIMTQEQIDGAVLFKDNILRIKKAIMGLALSVVSFDTINNALQRGIEKLIEWRKSDAFKAFIEKAQFMGSEFMRISKGVIKLVGDFVKNNEEKLKELTPIFAAVALAFGTGLAGPLINLSAALITGLITTLVSPLGAILLTITGMFAAVKWGEALNRSFDIDGMLSGWIIKFEGFFEKMKLYKNHKDFSQEGILAFGKELEKINETTANRIAINWQTSLENEDVGRKTSDIFKEDMIQSVTNAKESVKGMFTGLIPKEFKGISDLLNNKKEQSLKSKIGIAGLGGDIAKSLGFEGLEKLVDNITIDNLISKSTKKDIGGGIATKQTSKTDATTKEQVKEQKKTNTLLVKIVNDGGMTFL